METRWIKHLSDVDLAAPECESHVRRVFNEPNRDTLDRNLAAPVLRVSRQFNSTRRIEPLKHPRPCAHRHDTGAPESRSVCLLELLLEDEAERRRSRSPGHIGTLEIDNDRVPTA